LSSSKARGGNSPTRERVLGMERKKVADARGKQAKGKRRKGFANQSREIIAGTGRREG